jgi:hopanoid biosynthesis associated radical SAM protein HpnH
MTVPLHQAASIGGYIMGQHFKSFLRGQKSPKYPLVLMLEPLFRCNLACAGCGKIDYPDAILNRRLSVQECIDAVEECGAPMVAIPGGEPLLHKDMPEIVKELVARKKYVTLCTNALLLEKKIDQYQPSKYFNWSIHLDGLKEEHDRSVCQDGVYEKAIAAIKLTKQKGFRVNINCTLFTSNSDPERVAAFFDECMAIGVDNITVSPGYAYERAPDQEHFLNRTNTKNLFRNIFAKGKEREKMGKAKWSFSQSDLFLDFLAGNQTYKCTPWGMPTRNVFGWQKPCYLLGEGFVKSYKELMDETQWDNYGTGNYEKCSDCMVHCGYEPTAAMDAVTNPLKVMAVSLRGIKTEGEMAPEVDLTKQRKSDYVFSKHVEQEISRIDAEAVAKKAAVAGARSEAAE